MKGNRKWNKWIKTNYALSKKNQCKWTRLKKEMNPQKWTNKRKKKTILPFKCKMKIMNSLLMKWRMK